MATILLTGLPRSGTTLICSLLNELPDTIALAEPLQLRSQGDRLAAVQEVAAFIGQARESLLKRRAAVSKHVGGAVPDNTVSSLPGATLRGIDAIHGEIHFDKPLSPAFDLFLKHPGEFTALMDELLPEYPLFAIVRHPVAVLASWQTVDMPVQRGRMPMMERFCPELKDELDREENPLKRQIILMRFLLGRYSRLPAGRVLRYEDIAADPAKALASLSPKGAVLRRSLTPVDPRRRYPDVDLERLAEALLPLRGLIACFYPDGKIL